MIRSNILISFVLLLGTLSFAQNTGDFIFHDYKVINGYTTNTLAKNVLDVRIEHRFGDIGGSTGGWSTLFGLENAADILIGANYGLTDNITIGLNRTKGAGDLTQLVNLEGKWRFTKNDGEKPSAFALASMMSISTMDRNENDPSAINYFEQESYRIVYFGSLIWDKKFTEGLSLQANVSYVHRNYVQLNEDNDAFYAGLGLRAQITSTMALLLEGSVPLTGIDFENDQGVTEYYIPLAAGFEWTTGGGHIFQVSFTNSRGIAPTDYLVYSPSDFSDGEFRLGFTISRLFRL